ncbi:unnamed protein product [Diatraea saccharalis]|uniref:Uncharacterized protein n=1 Tax=Diatraea saccharalis TaxID=40085 RepID=A0A9N9WAP5_9NEOP|nr:unnamed protein product [Diatraea saccharalis]
MPDAVARYERMLFDYETTNLTDYRKPDFELPISTKYKEKPRCLAIRPPPVKDVHTLSEWKGQPIPFDLLHQPRPIVGTNPWHVQKKHSAPGDPGLAHAIKTRPRLVMTPAVSMDDIEDPRTREILCRDMYTSDATHSQREAVAEFVNVQAPFPNHPAPANPVSSKNTFLGNPNMSNIHNDGQRELRSLIFK